MGPSINGSGNNNNQKQAIEKKLHQLVQTVEEKPHQLVHEIGPFIKGPGRQGNRHK
jgi:hypothetical protein